MNTNIPSFDTVRDMKTEDLLNHRALTEYRVIIERETASTVIDDCTIGILRQHMAFFRDKGFECKYCWTTREV